MSVLSGDDYTMLGDSINPYSLKNSLRQSRQLGISGIQPEIDLQQHEDRFSQIDIAHKDVEIKPETLEEKDTEIQPETNEANVPTNEAKCEEQLQTQQAIKDAEYEALDKIYEQKSPKKNNEEDIKEHQIQQLTLANTTSEENKTLSKLSKLADKLNLKIISQNEAVEEKKIPETKNDENKDLAKQDKNNIVQNVQQQQEESEMKEPEDTMLSPAQDRKTQQKENELSPVQVKEPLQKARVVLSPTQDIKDKEVNHKQPETEVRRNDALIHHLNNEKPILQQGIFIQQMQQINDLQHTIQQKDFRIQQLESKQQSLEIMVNNLQLQLQQLQKERVLNSTVSQCVKPQLNSFGSINSNAIPIVPEVNQQTSPKKKNIFTSILKPQINSYVPSCLKYDYQNNDYDWSKDYQVFQKEMMDFSKQILEFQPSNQRVTLQKVKIQDQERKHEDDHQKLPEQDLQLKDVKKQKTKVDQIIAKNKRVANRCKNFNTSQLEYCDVQNKTTNGRLQPSITKYDLVDYDNVITSVGEAEL